MLHVCFLSVFRHYLNTQARPPRGSGVDSHKQSKMVLVMCTRGTQSSSNSVSRCQSNRSLVLCRMLRYHEYENWRTFHPPLPENISFCSPAHISYDLSVTRSSSPGYSVGSPWHKEIWHTGRQANRIENTCEVISKGTELTVYLNGWGHVSCSIAYTMIGKYCEDISKVEWRRRQRTQEITLPRSEPVTST